MDASVAVELLTQPENNERLVQKILEHGGDDIHVPNHFKLEILSALRGLYLKGFFTYDELQQKFAFVQQLIVTEYSVDTFLSRVINFVNNTTVYDAAYIALAEVLDCPVLTLDQRLASIPGCAAHVHIL